MERPLPIIPCTNGEEGNQNPDRQQNNEDKKSKGGMSGVKRDRSGFAKKHHHDGPKQGGPSKPVARNAYTEIFERFRDELDEHHDRRERIVKASRDITALSKKM